VLPPAAASRPSCFWHLLGAVAAKAGRAPILKAIIRVTFWGALAMAVTAGIGAAFRKPIEVLGSATLQSTANVRG